MAVAKQPAADAQDHRSVSLYQSGKGGFVARIDEATKQVRIGQVVESVCRPHPADVLHDRIQWGGRHGSISVQRRHSTIIVPRGVLDGTPFFCAAEQILLSVLRSED